MNLTVLYNNINITEEISADLQSCILTDRYGGLLDSIKIVLNDTEEKWNKYGMVEGDEVVVKTDGYSTGVMYISKFDTRDKIVSIDAVSLKPSKKKSKCKIWRNVRLSEVLTDCAKNNSLSLKTYGVTDHYYETLVQLHNTDLEFVSKVCIREGYSVKVDDNSLVVFNERDIEAQDTHLTITPSDVEPNYMFNQSSGTSSVTVAHYDLEEGMIEQTAIDSGILGGNEVINERVTSFDEAKRFAHGYLRSKNKRFVIGYLTMAYNPSLSAGTVFYADGFYRFDDKYVIVEISHDVKKEKSSLVVRKVLGY